MSLSQSTLIQRVRTLLQDNPWATTASAASSSSVVAVPDGTKWDEGAILEFQDTGEQCWVQSVSGNNLTCLRGYNGTTAATHASGNVVRDPMFTYKQVQEGAELAMQSLWPYCYKKVTFTITSGSLVTTPYKWYDLASDVMGLISVVQVDTSVTPNRLYRYGQRGGGRPVTWSLNLPTGLAASTVGIMFPRGLALSSVNLQVDYAAKITATVANSAYSDISDGILADIVTYGCAARLVAATDIPRATQEDIAMGDSSVQVGMRGSVGRNIYQTYLMLRNQYWDELRRTMPIMGQGAGGFGSGNFRIPPYP